MNNPRGIASTLLLAILVMLVASFGAYAYLQTKHTPASVDFSGFMPAASSTPVANTKPVTQSSAPQPDQNTDISVPGMSKYTDTDFGFSFWYPSSKTVTNTLANYYAVRGTDINQYASGMYGPGTQIRGSLSAPEFRLDEVYAPNMSILSSVDPGCCGSQVNKYFFDPSLHTWMEFSDGGPAGKGPSGTFAADVSKNTMGGLHILQGYTRFGDKVIIPLSAQHFLAVYSACNDATDYTCGDATNPISGYSRFVASIQTIVATDPSVATPVSVAQQIETIRSAWRAYTGIFEGTMGPGDQ